MEVASPSRHPASRRLGVRERPPHSPVSRSRGGSAAGSTCEERSTPTSRSKRCSPPLSSGSSCARGSMACSSCPCPIRVRFSPASTVPLSTPHSGETWSRRSSLSMPYTHRRALSVARRLVTGRAIRSHRAARAQRLSHHLGSPGDGAGSAVLRRLPGTRARRSPHRGALRVRTLRDLALMVEAELSSQRGML